MILSKHIKGYAVMIAGFPTIVYEEKDVPMKNKFVTEALSEKLSVCAIPISEIQGNYVVYRNNGVNEINVHKKQNSD